ncbi:hypothetical protein ACIBBE_24380 [Streptomyces sp. NPDC051644]
MPDASVSPEKTFATANARLWSEIAYENPGSWSKSLCDAAQQCAAFRSRI